MESTGLAASLGLMVGSLFPGQTFSFAGVPLNSSALLGINGVPYIISFSQYLINNVITSSSREGILTAYNTSALQIFLPLEVAISGNWIGIQLLTNNSNVIISINHDHVSLVNFNLLVSNSGKKRAPGVGINIINGAAPLVYPESITGPIIPPIVPNRPLVNGTTSALTDQDFVDRASSITKTLAPVCARDCEPLIPNYSTFKIDSSIETLNATCQAITPANITAYNTCAYSKPDCNNPGISSGSIRAKNFTLLFEDICHRFIQPEPVLTVKNRFFTFTFKNSSSLHILNFNYSITDVLNRTTYAGTEYQEFLGDSTDRRDLFDPLPLVYSGCTPVNSHSKYQICEGELVGANSCNGNVTAHLKFKEADLTKTSGSGYDDVLCIGSAVKSAGGKSETTSPSLELSKEGEGNQVIQPSFTVVVDAPVQNHFQPPQIATVAVVGEIQILQPIIRQTSTAEMQIATAVPILQPVIRYTATTEMETGTEVQNSSRVTANAAGNAVTVPTAKSSVPNTITLSIIAYIVLLNTC
ncbi:hypothetical protein HDU79_009533 [Rhizoclosmatium sp. JEL0117]|nr:hypothetical protein HDU79_009533 [Rhizoclosmatium sp. JEL0117]